MDLHISETVISLGLLLVAMYGIYRLGCWRETKAQAEPLDAEPEQEQTIYDRGRDRPC